MVTVWLGTISQTVFELIIDIVWNEADLISMSTIQSGHKFPRVTIVQLSCRMQIYKQISYRHIRAGNYYKINSSTLDKKATMPQTIF